MRVPEIKCRGLRFGVFEADLELHELRKHGLRIKLTGQPFQALTLLLENPGKVVTRDELRKALWPDEPWGDHDQRVNKIINKIREALSDSADVPRYLETVPRIGYRFLIPVERLGEFPISAEVAPDLPAAETPPAAAPAVAEQTNLPAPVLGSSGLRRLWPMLAAISISLAIGVGLSYHPFAKRIESPRIAEPTPLTTYVGSELYPSFSPDGKQVVFAWDGDSRIGFHIYTAVVGGGGERRITDDAKNDYGPVWAPDGRQIAFLRQTNDRQAEVWIVQPDGKAARKIKEIERANTDHALSWTQDSASLVVAARTQANGRSALFLISTKTGDQRQITASPAPSVNDLSPAVSPDGRSLAFTRATSASWRDIFVVSLAENHLPLGEPVRLTDLHRLIDTIAWTADSRGLVFSAATTTAGARHLFRIDASSSALNHDFAETGIEGDYPAISRTGSKLVYVRNNIAQSSIWRLELDNPSAAPRQSRLVSSTRRDYTTDISPDGKRLVFSSVRSGPSEIWMSDTDGSNLKKITSQGASTPRWSPDGRRIVFESNTRGQPDIYVYTLETNAIERLTSDGASNLRPSWSRDGKFVYFGSDRNGKSQIWKVPGSGGDAVQITRKGGLYAIETFDGKSIYYTSADQPACIRTVPANGGEETDVIANAVGYSTIAMARDGIYYLSGLTTAAPQLYFYNFAKRTSRRLASIDKPVHRFLSSSLDGRSVLYTKIDRQDSDLMLVDPFR